MRRTALLVLLTAIIATGCTRIQPEWTDIPDTGLSQKSSFRIDTATAPKSLDGDEKQLWEDRRTLIRGLIRAELVARGYREAINDPDFVIRFWGRRGGDYAQEHHYDEPKGTIDIRAMDPPTGKWLWHGWATETMVKRLDAEEEIREAVPMILEKFPRSASKLQ
jgi:hypothetical protein